MFRRDTLFAFLILALFVVAGLQSVWGIALELGQKIVTSMVTIYPGQLLVDPDGQLVFERFEDGELRYRTTDGKPLAVPKRNYWLDGARLTAPLGEKQRRERLSWPERVSGATEPTRPPTTWYLVHSQISDGEAYLVGYNEVSKARVGYIGRDGFRGTLPPRDQWFSIVGGSYRQFARQSSSFRESSGTMATSGSLDRHEGIYLVSGGEVWHLDLGSRVAEVFYPSTDAVSLASSPVVARAAADKVPEDWSGGPFYVLAGAGLLVRTPSEVIGVDYQGRKRKSWTIPPSLRGRDFTWYELADGAALVAEQRSDTNVATVVQTKSML